MLLCDDNTRYEGEFAAVCQLAGKVGHVTEHVQCRCIIFVCTLRLSKCLAVFIFVAEYVIVAPFLRLFQEPSSLMIYLLVFRAS